MALGNVLSGVKGSLSIDLNVLSVGTGGTIKVAHVTRWSADIRRDVVNPDSFDDADNFKNKIGGMHDIAGTCEGWMDDALAFNLTKLIATDHVPSAASILLIVKDGTVFYGFLALISNLNMQVVKGSDLSRFTCSFESSGVISVTGGT